MGNTRPDWLLHDIRNETREALHHARAALNLSRNYQERRDCLRVAVEALEGALRNVEYELDPKEPKP